MADANSVLAKVQLVVNAANDALTEAQAVAGQPAPPDLSTQVAALTAQVATLTASNTDLSAKVDVARTALQALKTADDAENAVRDQAITALG